MTEDGQLLENYAREGDVESLSTLVGRHSGWLVAYLRGLMPTDADADDAAQETWVRLVRSCASYRGGSVRAYLVRIARSVAIDRFRRMRPTVSIDAGDGMGLTETLADAAPAPDAAFECSATAEDVRRAIRSLPENLREVMLMRIEGELSFREIAELLGIPLGTALTWMRVATMRLKKMLGGGK